MTRAEACYWIALPVWIIAINTAPTGVLKVCFGVNAAVCAALGCWEIWGSGKEDR